MSEKIYFGRYYSHEELFGVMKELADDFPNLCTLYCIGKSI